MVKACEIKIKKWIEKNSNRIEDEYYKIIKEEVNEYLKDAVDDFIDSYYDPDIFNLGNVSDAFYEYLDSRKCFSPSVELDYFAEDCLETVCDDYADAKYEQWKDENR